MALVQTNALPFTVDALTWDGTPPSAALYEQDGSTLITQLTQASAISFTDGERQNGRGSVTLPLGTAECTAALSTDPRIVRISFGGSVRFDFYIQNVNRSISDEDGGTVTFSGPGLRRGLAASKVHPADNCALIPNPGQRYLGVQDPSYDPSALPTATSWSTWKDQESQGAPFNVSGSIKAADFPDPDAHFIWDSSVGSESAPGYAIIHSPDFSVSADGAYVLSISADDEYDVWINGTLIGSSRGEFRWKVTDNYTVTLCAGIVYRIVIRVNNLARSGVNIAWGLASIAAANDDGEVDQTNQQYSIEITATDGLWTATVDGSTTAGMAHNISSSNLQSVLESLPSVGAGNVTVTGSGSPAADHTVSIHNDATTGTFGIGVDGQFTDAIAYDAAASTVKTELEALSNITTVTVTGSGTEGDPWIITVTDPAQTSFSFTTTDSFSGTGSSTVTTTATGGEADPYIVTFIGDLAGTAVTMTVDGSSLDPADAISITEEAAGTPADILVHTDETWKIDAYPTSLPGLNVGEIFILLHAEMVARGSSVFDHFTFTFDATEDSKGNDWTEQFEIPASLYTTSVEDIAQFFELRGYDVWFSPDWTFNVAQASKGADRTAEVDISSARLSKESTFSQDREVATVTFARDEFGQWNIETAPSAITTHGRWEEPYSAPAGTVDSVTLWQRGALDESSTPYEEYTVTVSPDTSDQFPFRDFEWGDLIVAQGIDGLAVTVRVVSNGLKTIESNEAMEFPLVVVEQ